MNKKIWLVRHGQSMSQFDSTVSGMNPNLSPIGEAQARRLKDRLARIQVEEVWLSPQTRAWRTYDLSEHRAPLIRIDKHLAESDWGIPDHYRNLQFEEPPGFAQPDPSDAHLLPVRERARVLVDRMVNMDCASCMLVGHWGIFFEILKTFVGASSDEIRFIARTENTGVSLLEIEEDGRRVLRFWNDTAHLTSI